eukprot:1033413-Prymnesium_polylepis.1
MAVPPAAPAGPRAARSPHVAPRGSGGHIGGRQAAWTCSQPARRAPRYRASSEVESKKSSSVRPSSAAPSSSSERQLDASCGSYSSSAASAARGECSAGAADWWTM